jgi:4-aminobutyrate aminotransferase-like enzyme
VGSCRNNYQLNHVHHGDDTVQSRAAISVKDQFHGILLNALALMNRFVTTHTSTASMGYSRVFLPYMAQYKV